MGRGSGWEGGKLWRLVPDQVEVGTHGEHSLTWSESCSFYIIRPGRHLPLLFKKVLFGGQGHQVVTLFWGHMSVCISQCLLSGQPSSLLFSNVAGSILGVLSSNRQLSLALLSTDGTFCSET